MFCGSYEHVEHIAYVTGLDAESACPTAVQAQAPRPVSGGGAGKLARSYERVSLSNRFPSRLVPPLPHPRARARVRLRIGEYGWASRGQDRLPDGAADLLARRATE